MEDLSSTSSSGRSLLVRGIDLTTFEVPRVMLHSELVEGKPELGIRPALPVDDVHVILLKATEFSWDFTISY